MSEATPFGIYLHIPYCKAKCRYCDFYSAPGAHGVPQSYVDALLRELAKNMVEHKFKVTVTGDNQLIDGEYADRKSVV